VELLFLAKMKGTVKDTSSKENTNKIGLKFQNVDGYMCMFGGREWGKG
jgi:hypothetical protein